MATFTNEIWVKLFSKYFCSPIYILIFFCWDFDGQRRAEKTFQVIIVLFAAVGFTWGYICQQFSQTMYIMLAGFALSCLLTLPPWPMYRTKPLAWQKVKKETEHESQPSTSGQKSKKKK